MITGARPGLGHTPGAFWALALVAVWSCALGAGCKVVAARAREVILGGAQLGALETHFCLAVVRLIADDLGVLGNGTRTVAGQLGGLAQLEVGPRPDPAKLLVRQGGGQVGNVVRKRSKS